MRPTVAFWLGITALILFAATVLFMSTLTNSTLWTDMNNSLWETGFMMVFIPFVMFVFAGALLVALFKGPESKFRIGSGQE